jgi:UDP-glucose 4-epimerase
MSFERPAWVEQVNHWGTAHLVEACLEMGVARFVYASTTAVYGPGGPFVETDPCLPQGAYAQSKRRAERAVTASAKRGLGITVLRFGILYGLAPITRFDAVANRLVYLAGVERPLTVYGDGQQRRSLVHVRDASQAIAFCLAHPELTAGRALNVIDQNVSVLELVETIRHIKPHIPVRFAEQDIRTHLSFTADNSELTRLGWRPQVAMRDGLAELLEQFNSFEAMAIPAANEI